MEVKSSSYLVTKRGLKPRRSDFGVCILLPFLPNTMAFRSNLINAPSFSDFFFSFSIMKAKTENM